ncbi:MAG: hypothetical protein WA958_02720 [Tunicatimonas sp.]
MKAESILILIFIVFAIIILVGFYIMGKAALSVFPDIKTVNVKYRDLAASGYSTTSLVTKMGGARNVLDIVVTDTELWLKSMVLFAGIGQQYDLLHKIPLNKIVKVEKIGRKVQIDFQTKAEEDKQVVLITKKPDALIQNLKR